MKLSKRGISSMLVTSFIILGVIIGAALLWVFVLRIIHRSDEVNPDCLTVNLDIVGCSAYGQCYYGGGGGAYEANILVKRKTGEGNVTGIRFIFEDVNGIQRITDQDLNTYSLNELESVSFTEPYNAVPVPSGEPRTVRVAALVGEKKEACPITSRSETCGIINMPPPLGAIPNISGSYPVSSPRVGYCCQWPVNTSECYIGGDPNFIVNPVTGQLNGRMPPGNITLCCTRNPYTGGTT